MLVPAEVADHVDALTDDEIVALYVAAGLGEGYGRACVEILRGRIEGPVN